MAALFGALSGGKLAKIGRRYAMIVVDLISILGILICFYGI